jgi:predicted phosphodiesterase
MKIATCSDIHLEFGEIELKNPSDVEVLILSGDICVAADILPLNEKDLPGFANAKSEMIHEFFQNCCREFKHVIYIAGNHEHYHGDYIKTIPKLKELLGYNVNLHILDKERVEFNNVVFLGGTLWTDMNKEDPKTLAQIRGMMNDFRTVEKSDEVVHYKTPIYAVKEDGSYDYDNVVSMEFHTRTAKFSPQDAVVDHKAMLEFIDSQYKDIPPWKTIVVVGHHAPSKASTHPRYRKEELMNGGYSSDLDNFILDRPGIKLWTHGHTHEDFDYMVGNCRIVCNPRGYIHYEDRADRFELKVVEV